MKFSEHDACLESPSLMWSFWIVLLMFIVNYQTCGFTELMVLLKRVWRYQRGNQNPSIAEGQTTQWPQEKAQKDKQRPKKKEIKLKIE